MTRKGGENGGSKDRTASGAAAPESEESMLQSIEGATSAWLDQMAAMRRVETEFASRLARCRTAPEAIGVCTEWLAKRVDSLIAVQHHLIDLWLECETGRLGQWPGKEQRADSKGAPPKGPVRS